MSAPNLVTVADRILRWPEARKIVSISKSTVDRLEARGAFPRRVQLSDYCVGWRLSELSAWVAGKRDWTCELQASRADRISA